MSAPRRPKFGKSPYFKSSPPFSGRKPQFFGTPRVNHFLGTNQRIPSPFGHFRVLRIVQSLKNHRISKAARYFLEVSLHFLRLLESTTFWERIDIFLASACAFWSAPRHPKSGKSTYFESSPLFSGSLNFLGPLESTTFWEQIVVSKPVRAFRSAPRRPQFGKSSSFEEKSSFFGNELPYPKPIGYLPVLRIARSIRKSLRFED